MGKNNLKSKCQHNNFVVIHYKLECPVCRVEKEKADLMFNESDLIKAENDAKITIISQIKTTSEKAAKILKPLIDKIEGEAKNEQI